MEKKYVISVKYSPYEREALYTTDIEDIKENDYVTVITERGQEIGKVVGSKKDASSFPGGKNISPIMSIPSMDEIRLFENNEKKGKDAIKVAKEEAKVLGLDMNFLSAEYLLDRSKVIITYTAEGRIDFRELLKTLSSRLHTRIEFKQIGSRDEARAIGGLGPCGRECCCAKFLKNFDGISINRAKNQQLTLNNAKLSGTCGKLMCCLLFEDETYTKESKDFPAIGSSFKLDGSEYKVLGFNIVSRQVKCMSKEGVVFIDLKDIKK